MNAPDYLAAILDAASAGDRAKALALSDLAADAAWGEPGGLGDAPSADRSGLDAFVRARMAPPEVPAEDHSEGRWEELAEDDPVWEAFAARPARGEGEEWQTAGRWYRREGGKTVRFTREKKEPAAKKPKGAKADTEPKPLKKAKVSVDEIHQQITAAAGRKPTKEDAQALAGAIGRLTDAEVKELRGRLGLSKGGGKDARKADRVKGVVDKVMAGAESKAKDAGKKTAREIAGAKKKADGPIELGDAPKAPAGEATLDVRAVAAALDRGDYLDSGPPRARDVIASVKALDPKGRVAALGALGIDPRTPDSSLPMSVPTAVMLKQKAAKEASRKPVAEWRKHPTLQALGQKLTVAAPDSDASQTHLRHLAKVPEALARRVGGEMKQVAVGDAMVPDLDDLGHLRNQQPRGWAPGDTWAKVGGAYDGNRLVVAAGSLQGSGSASTALHEFGHAADDVLGYASTRADFAELHREIYDTLPAYLQQDGPGGRAGCSETFAECFAATLIDEPAARRKYGVDMVDWMKTHVLGAQ